MYTDFYLKTGGFMRKSKTIKRTISGVLSLALLANFGTVFPIEAFAHEEADLSTKEAYLNDRKYQIFDSAMHWKDAEAYLM